MPRNLKSVMLVFALATVLIPVARASFFQYTTQIAPGAGLKVNATQGGDGSWTQQVGVVGAISAATAPNTNGSAVNNAAVTTTPATFAAPANAVGFILEAESGNTANIRWAVGTTASSTVGTLAEPGRDTGYIPVGAGISVVAISGTQSISVQWVLSQ